ncbi:HAMP domain-containing histidine kinase [Paenibacillus sp. TRM 82003]|nr:HAMP domain-containing histidine kinase [Paenibacillus sp. TRM 82003]
MLMFLPVTEKKPTETEMSLSAWNMHWIEEADGGGRIPPAGGGAWHNAGADHPLLPIPDGHTGAWIRLTVPPTSGFSNPGLYIERLYALDYEVYQDGASIFRAARDYDMERTVLLVPMTPKPTDSEVLIRVEAKEFAGIDGDVRVGNFERLSSQYFRKGLPDLLLGAAIAFLGAVMLTICGTTLWKHRKQATALSLFIVSTGILILTYSLLPSSYYPPEYGNLLLFLFDTSMLILFPSLYYFAVHIHEETAAFFRQAFRWLLGYSVFCFFILIAYQWIGDSFYFYYKLFTYWILAPLILLQLLTAIGFAFRHAFRGNRDSLLLSGGILGLGLSGIADMVLLSVLDRPYVLVLWKFGVVFLIFSLLIILIRRIAADHSRLLAYAKELEMHGHELQKTERMRLISELAASIAHEIRNPLQVTRGFLQLLSRHATKQTENQYAMAIEELDRASDIISDFLTVAKPQQETIVEMDIKQQLKGIESIMGPLITMHGGELRVSAADRLIMMGNVSKFKQAIINMLKNSIESCQDQGRVEVEAHAEGDTIVIRIADNGIGMEPDQIAKLGEPYFSTKTKGTGLGLMVTFRIVEMMQGTLEFRSEIGKGTEAVLRFPLARQNLS